MKFNRLIVLLCLALLVGLSVSVVLAQDPVTCPSDLVEGDKCRVVLVNSFLGNDYRIQMQRSASAAATYEPFASSFDFSVQNSENTPEAQRALIENLLLEGIDVLILNAVDDQSVNDLVEQACEDGVLVVTFDITAKAGSCEFRVEFDFYNWAVDAGKWLALETGADEQPINVIMDHGLQGVSIADDIYQGGLDGMTSVAPEENINIVGEYYGEFAEGPQEPQISAILAANPDTQIDVVYTQGYCTTVVSAFENAGLDYTPAMYCQGYNANHLLCAQEGMRCFINAASFSGSIGSMDTAYRLLAGEKIQCAGGTERGLEDEWAECVIPWGTRYYVTAIHDIGENSDRQELLELGVNAFPDLPLGFGPYYQWPGSVVEITLEEAAGITGEATPEATAEASG